MKRILFGIILVLITFNNIACSSSKKKISYKEYYQETQGHLIKRVEFKGLLISDRRLLENIGKSYKNKYVTQTDVGEIIAKVKSAYLESGYAGLVSVSHKINRHQLTIQIDMVE